MLLDCETILKLGTRIVVSGEHASLRQASAEQLPQDSRLAGPPFLRVVVIDLMLPNCGAILEVGTRVVISGEHASLRRASAEQLP